MATTEATEAIYMLDVSMAMPVTCCSMCGDVCKCVVWLDLKHLISRSSGALLRDPYYRSSVSQSVYGSDLIWGRSEGLRLLMNRISMPSARSLLMMDQALRLRWTKRA